MGKNMTSGARRLSGNAVTLLITALLCGGSAALIYSGAASRQISNMLISMACYIVMAVSLNLVVGLLGELSLGHAGFMSVGLFTGCLLSIQLAQSVPIGVRMPLSMLLGGVAAAVVLGVERLHGAAVRCTDLRGGAALCAAALAAEGETSISDITHIDRGYQSIEDDLAALGADIRRVEETASP